MRITFVLPDANLGGGTRVIAMFALHLHRRGHEVLVVSTPWRHASLPRRALDWALGRGWRPGLEVLPSHLDGLGVPRRVLADRRPVVDADLPEADVVVATWWETAEWVARLSPSKGAKAYFIQQYEANFGHAADRVDATWRLPLRKIVCSGWLADLARERFGDATAVVAPNGIDLDLFHAPVRGRQARPTVGLMYATGHAKGFDLMRTAVGELRRRVPGLLVRACGVPAAPPELAAGPGSEYWRDPPQERLRELYAGCDVWLCASRSEGYHLPPHEAMACRCPVVSTRVGGPIELVRDGENGYLVDVGDAGGLADRAALVLGLPDDRWRRMSDAAYDSVRGYDWAAATDRFEAALAAAAAGVDEVATGPARR